MLATNKQMARVPAMQEEKILDRAERKLRRIGGWLLVLCLTLGQLGAPWDGEWHGYIGRDWFWTPPHILIYTCVGGGGLIALAMVLLETLRYRKGCPGVHDESTVHILRLFHAPLGFIVVGCGTLAALVAAPFDNYWHELYGIDISLWSPFHIMGITGCFIGTIGIVYVLASEAAIDRQAGRRNQRFLGITALEWGALFAIASLLKLTLTGFLLFPVIDIGLLRLPTYLLPAVICTGLCLISAVRLTVRPGAATIMTMLLFPFWFATELFVPWATRTLVAQQGLHYRVAGRIPHFGLNSALLPLFVLLSALIVDGIMLWRMRRKKAQHATIYSTWLLGLGMGLLESIVAPCIVLWTVNPYQAFLNSPTLIVAPAQQLYATLIVLPIILAGGVLGALWGASMGDMWHVNKQ